MKSFISTITAVVIVSALAFGIARQRGAGDGYNRAFKEAKRIYDRPPVDTSQWNGWSAKFAVSLKTNWFSIATNTNSNIGLEWQAGIITSNVVVFITRPASVDGFAMCDSFCVLSNTLNETPIRRVEVPVVVEEDFTTNTDNGNVVYCRRWSNRTCDQGYIIDHQHFMVYSNHLTWPQNTHD